MFVIILKYDRSVQRNMANKECSINLETKQSHPFACKSSADFNYWQLSCHGCFNRILNRYLSVHKKILYNKSEASCKVSCLTADFGCKSAQFNTVTNICFLSDETRFTIPHKFLTSPDYIYWDRSIPCNSNCYFKHHSNKYLLGFNTEILSLLPLDKCLEACFDRVNFYCLSVDYNTQTQTCVLSTESKDTQPQVFKYNYFIDHYERICP